VAFTFKWRRNESSSASTNVRKMMNLTGIRFVKCVVEKVSEKIMVLGEIEREGRVELNLIMKLEFQICIFLDQDGFYTVFYKFM
jgi:hypothetical protein